MPKNLFAIGTNKNNIGVVLGDQTKKATFNNGYNVFYEENVTLNTKFFIGWSEAQAWAEERNISWFSIIIGEDYEDIEIESFEATIQGEQDFTLHEVFGIETVIIYNFI